MSKEDFEKKIKELEADCKKLVDIDKRFELVEKGIKREHCAIVGVIAACASWVYFNILMSIMIGVAVPYQWWFWQGFPIFS